MIKDILSDFFTKIRNANDSKHKIVEVISTTVTNSITKILKEEGFIANFKICKHSLPNVLLIYLKYLDQKHNFVLSQLKSISKPSFRIYTCKKRIKKKLVKTDIFIISTSKGIMTDYKAKKLNLGGEVLCVIS